MVNTQVVGKEEFIVGNSSLGRNEGISAGENVGEVVGSDALSINCILCDGSKRNVSMSRIPTIFSSTKNNSLSRNTLTF
jgi:hypothetical protein